VKKRKKGFSTLWKNSTIIELWRVILRNRKNQRNKFGKKFDFLFMISSYFAIYWSFLSVAATDLGGSWKRVRWT
jgi:hypothetical protein